MNLNEAIQELRTNGYELIDEGFWMDAYQKYKQTVLKLLKKYKVDFLEQQKAIEDWIRDYFLDKLPADECAAAIRDNF